MSFEIVPSKRFLKKVRKHRKGGQRNILAAAEEAIRLLSVHDQESIRILAEEWRDHLLTGDKRGIRELHLDQDDLLLYRVDADDAAIELLDIVTHEELRKM